MITLTLLFYVFSGMPWVLAFEDLQIGDPLFYFELAIDIIFFFDILISLNSSYIKATGEIETSRKKIFVNYLKGMLIIDVLAVFPFFLLS
mmetsp:Transcript_21503/g.3503  ORF Transcript_21503/g.3503 Transcript_21503/m.3503 type:complete len:90 (+) Transcript_21503:79-348(+)